MTTLRQACIEAMAAALKDQDETYGPFDNPHPVHAYEPEARAALDALLSTLTEQLIGANPPVPGQTYTVELLAVLGASGE